MADTINRIVQSPGEAQDQLLIYGDYPNGSSIVFYTQAGARCWSMGERLR